MVNKANASYTRYSYGVNYLNHKGTITTTSVGSEYDNFLLTLNNVESRLEIALAGFKKKEIKVYTEYGKLVVEGTKENKETQEYLHRGLASRSFKREWSLSDDIEVKDVTFADGLLIAKLGKIVPEHHARKDYL